MPSRIVRLIAAAAIGLAVLPASSALPAAAADPCETGYTNKKVAPPTVRVLRTKTNTVDVVDFRRYVGIVMASGEWPSWMARASLQAGAVAVKQYAWYYILDGHHRDSYRTKSGACYDVKDTTTDQLYRPEKAEVRPKQREAISATWGLTLRKGDRFFLTGYRAGSASQCGKDADGFRLYQKSVEDCADDGLSRQQIQEIYYAPNVRFVWADGKTPPDPEPGPGEAPEVTAPKAGVRLGATLGNGATVVSWSGSDAEKDLARYTLQHSVNGGSWRNVSLSEAKQTSTRIALSLGDLHRFRVRATDAAGHVGEWKTGPSFRPLLVQETSNAIDWAGSWTRAVSSSASGGATRYTVAGGATASYVFTGRTVAYVTPRGPTRGRAEIRVDGTLVATVNLETSVGQPRKVVFHRTWSSVGSHTIEVRRLDDRVDLDAFLVYK